MTAYTEYDSIKIKLRVNDDTMKEEIELHMQDMENDIDGKIRAKLGSYNVYGQAITLPLTDSTIPPIPPKLKGIANDLVVARIRLQNSQKPLLLETHEKKLDDYLDTVFGWTQSGKYQPIRTLTVSPLSGPVGTVITISGTNYEPTAKLDVIFDHTNPTTTPTSVITDGVGVFSGVTFQVPATTPTGAYKIKVSDGFGGLEHHFQVT